MSTDPNAAGMKIDIGSAAGETPEAVVAETPRIVKKQMPGGYWFGTGRRKTSVARVRIKAGEGKIIVNNRPAEEYFSLPRDRYDIHSPLEVTNTSKMDIWVNVNGGGISGQAGAIRLGLSRALVHYNVENEQALRDNGFLTRDSRRVERKKYGRAGARKRFQFSKR